MATTRVFTDPKTSYRKADGVTVNSAGKLYFREPGVGSTTLKNVYSNKELTAPLLNPIVLDEGGRSPEIYLDGDYNVQLMDSDDVQVWRIDHYQNIVVEGQFDEWNPALTYSANDYVQYSDGTYYLSLQSGNTGNVPNTSPNYWLKAFISQFDQWDSEIRYAEADYVRHTDDLYYISLTDNNLNNAPDSNPANWSQAFFFTVYNSLVTYSQDDVVYYEGNIYTSKTNSNVGNTPDTSYDDWRRPGISVPEITGYQGQIIKYIAVTAPSGSFNLVTTLPNDTTSTVGPTGSGATYEWSALDDLPDNATSVSISTTATASRTAGTLEVYSIESSYGALGTGGIVPAADLADYGSVDEASIIKSVTIVDVPLGAGNVIDVYYQYVNSDSQSMFLSIRGFSVEEV